MGNYFTGNQFNVLKLDVKTQMNYIITNWIRESDNALSPQFDIQIIQLIINKFTYRSIFDIERESKLLKPDTEEKDTNIVNTFNCKITLLGNDKVGKRTMFESLGAKPYSYDTLKKTINIEDDVIQLLIWHPDVRKIRSMKCITSMPCTTAKGVIFMYDITNVNSFNDIKQWHKYFIKYNRPELNTKTILIGNKLDLVSSRNDLGTVSTDMALNLCKELNIETCMDISATNNEHANDALLSLIKKIYAPYKRINNPFYDY
eukprot:488341_1